MQVYRVEQIFTLEDVDPPLLGGRWFAPFRRLVVFEYGRCTRDGVGFFGEQAGGFVVGFFFFHGFAVGADYWLFPAEGVGLRWEWYT